MAESANRMVRLLSVYSSLRAGGGA